MTWVKIDDGFPDHPKVVGLSDAAFRLYVSSLCYASRNLTDGLIPNAMIARLGGSEPSVVELTEARLWVAQNGAHFVHDYLKHQSSREQVEAAKDANRKRVQRYKERKSNGVTNGVGNAQSHAEVMRPDTETDTETDTEPLLLPSQPSAVTVEAGDSLVPYPRVHSARAAVERISDKLMEARANGINAWNLSRLVEDEWDSLHNANDIGGCIALTAWYVSELQSRVLTSAEIGRIGQMTKRFGRIALLAIDEAASKDLTDLVSYAFRIAQSMHKERTA